jgi:S1-C subfamily serine protease
MRARLRLRAGLLVALVLGARAATAAPTAASLVEREFAATIKRVAPATVVCLGKGAPRGFPGSSGVLIAKDGWVLSDGDSPLVAIDDAGKRTYAEEVEVRVPDPKSGTTTTYAAKVVRRDPALDTSLLKIRTPPAGGFPFVVPATADDVRVGSIAFVTGNSFGSGLEGTPTLTAGVIAGLVRQTGPTVEALTGRFLELYTSAATNPGVNGGPLVDVDGRLVGVVSTWIQPSAGDPATLSSPYQFLTKAFPIDRLRAYYRALPADVLPNSAALFPDPKPGPPRAKQSASLETAIVATAAEAAGRVVSLTVERSEPLKMEVGKNAIERYRGPASGVLVSKDGWIVTSLYTLANTTPLALPRSEPSIADDLKKIVSISAHVGGKTFPARLVADHHRLGIALVKAETGEAAGGDVWTTAPPEAFQVGRMVLSVANPFGDRAEAEPLLTFGIVSRVHPDDAEGPWRGNVQTDAGGTDATAGGALVDLRGRLLGVSTIWSPFIHGRNSGIAFGIPWTKVLEALPRLKEGRSVRFPFLGVEFDTSASDARLVLIVPGGAAEKAGVKVGDRIVAIDGKPVKTALDAIRLIRDRTAGDAVRLRLDRGGTTVEVEAVLAERTI